MGDPTAALQGRLTLNPVAHIDPFGTVVFPLLQFLSMGTVFFGWAKPVPVDPRHFANPRRGMMWVALGGPAANLAQLLLAGLLLQGAVAFYPGLPGMLLDSGPLEGLGRGVAVPLALMLVHAVHFNALLMAFNLIPIPPLDGSRVAYALLPLQWARKYAKIERYGMWIIFGLLFIKPEILRAVIDPIRRLALALVGMG